MNPSDAVIAISTVDTEKEAKRIAGALVESHIAACVNIIPKVVSIYEWQNEICEETELLLVIKTKGDRIEDLKATLDELHPYEVPELLFLPVQDGLPDYLHWLFENTK